VREICTPEASAAVHILAGPPPQSAPAPASEHLNVSIVVAAQIQQYLAQQLAAAGDDAEAAQRLLAKSCRMGVEEFNVAVKAAVAAKELTQAEASSREAEGGFWKPWGTRLRSPRSLGARGVVSAEGKAWGEEATSVCKAAAALSLSGSIQWLGGPLDWGRRSKFQLLSEPRIRLVQRLSIVVCWDGYRRQTLRWPATPQRDRD
jgi:hypothetical protein